MGRAFDFISEVRVTLGGCVSCEKLHFGRKRTFSSMSTTPLQGVAAPGRGFVCPAGQPAARVPVPWVLQLQWVQPARPLAQGQIRPFDGFVPAASAASRLFRVD